MMTDDGVPSSREASPMRDGDQLSQRLMEKISAQAVQLTNLAKAFNGSAEYIEVCEARIRELEGEAEVRCTEGASDQNLSEAASKRSNDRESSKRLEEAEQLLLVSSDHIGDLERDIRLKDRQCKLRERKIVDLNVEAQKMRAQIESYQHASRLMAKPIGLDSNRKVVAGLKSEIDALKAYLNSFQTRLEASKKAERAMALKVSILEDERDAHSQGLYSEAQAKVLILTEKVKKLKSELHKKVEVPPTVSPRSPGAICEREDILKPAPSVGHSRAARRSSRGGGLEVEDNQRSGVSGVSSVTSTDSRGEKVAALERVIVSLQLKLDEGETERIRNRDRESEKEVARGRDHSPKSSENIPENIPGNIPENIPGNILEKLQMIEQERDVLLEFIQGDMKRSAEINIDLKREKERGSRLDGALNASLSKEKLLRAELESFIRGINGNRNGDKDEGNDGVKEDYIVSVLSSELRAAHAKVLALEEQVAVLEGKTSGLEGEDDVTGDDVYNSRMKMKKANTDLSLSRTNTSTLQTSCTAPSSKLPWRKILASDIESRRAQDDWQLERQTLIRELEAIRPVDKALAELGNDLKKLRAKDIEGGLYSDEAVSSPTRVPLKLTSVRSYSNIYSQASQAAAGCKNRSISPSVSYSSRQTRYDSPTRSRPPIKTAENRSSGELIIGESLITEEPHGSLCRQHSWVALPSVPRLSQLLHERIKRLFNDLHRSESSCMEMEESLACMKSELSRSEVASEREIQTLTHTAAAAQSALESCKEVLKRSESDLRAERGAAGLLEDTLDVVCGVPGGWEGFFGIPSGGPDFTHSPHSKRVQRERNGTHLNDRRNEWKNGPREPSSTPRSQLSFSSPSPSTPNRDHSPSRPRSRTLDLIPVHGSRIPDGSARSSVCANEGNNRSAVWSTEGGDGGREGSSSSVQKRFSRLSAAEDRNKHYSRERAATGQKGERSDESLRPPVSMVPSIVSRAVAMLLSSSSKIDSAQRDLAQSQSTLHTVQGLLRDAKEENKKLSSYAEGLQQRDESREHSFVRIESSVRRDLERERTLSNNQNQMVLKLKAKLDALRSDGNTKATELLLQRKERDKNDQNDKLELCNVLREYKQRARVGSVPAPSFGVNGGHSGGHSLSTESWADLTGRTRDLLRALVVAQYPIRSTEDRGGSMGARAGGGGGAVVSVTSVSDHQRQLSRSAGVIVGDMPYVPTPSHVLAPSNPHALTPSTGGSDSPRDSDSCMTPPTEASDSEGDMCEVDGEDEGGGKDKGGRYYGAGDRGFRCEYIEGGDGQRGGTDTQHGRDGAAPMGVQHMTQSVPRMPPNQSPTFPHPFPHPPPPPPLSELNCYDPSVTASTPPLVPTPSYLGSPPDGGGLRCRGTQDLIPDRNLDPDRNQGIGRPNDARVPLPSPSFSPSFSPSPLHIDHSGRRTRDRASVRITDDYSVPDPPGAPSPPVSTDKDSKGSPSEQLDYRLRKAKQTFAALRSQIGSDFLS